MTPRSATFASVLIDVDSTLSRIEGIEWLSRRRSPEIGARITETTNAAMAGDIPLEAVYGERLALVAPTRDEVSELGRAYVEAVSPGAKETIQRLQGAGVRVVIISGGILESILPLAHFVGVPAHDTCAVSISFDAAGRYIDYDRKSFLTHRGGKPQVVESLALPTPTLAVGDGITDAEMRAVVQRFVAFTGVVRHARVVQLADGEIQRFTDLIPLVIPETSNQSATP